MNAHDPRLDPVAELKANVAVPFERAKAMPKSVHTSEDFCARQPKDIFAQEWFCLGRVSTFAAPGDYVTAERAGQPVTVLRDRDGKLDAR
jgi:phenylpropionate dioxygenase-like ring-hydroxylating dioxygenase large terminal subunit